MSEINAQLAADVSAVADFLGRNGFVDHADTLRLAARRLEGEISEAKVKAAAAAMLKDDPTVFGMLTEEELEQSVRAALEAARGA